MKSEPPQGDELTRLLAATRQAVLEQAYQDSQGGPVRAGRGRRLGAIALAVLLVLGLGTAGTAIALNATPRATEPANTPVSEPSTTASPTDNQTVPPLPVVTPVPAAGSPAGLFVPGARPADIDLTGLTALDPAEFAADQADQTEGGIAFNSPSRNLDCGIVPAYTESSTITLWGCAIRQQDWTAPTASPDDYCYQSEIPCGRGIEALGDAAPHLRQRSDQAFSSESSDTTPSLRYGSSITYQGITCASTEQGMICEDNATGHGFRISRSRHDMW